jgi:hypothetical protein
MNHSQKGNAFLYVLIAIILFAGLAFTLSRSGSQRDPVGSLTEGRVTIDANNIIAYAASVSNMLSQLDVAGVSPDQLDFILPSDAAFNTPPLDKKFFHPAGGGVNYKALPSEAIASNGAGLAPGYYVGRFNNVEWTPTAANDVIFAAHEISESVCKAINTKITGSDTVPALAGASSQDLLIDDSLHGGSNVNFMVVNCAACDEKPALCVSSGGTYTFYSVLVAD